MMDFSSIMNRKIHICNLVFFFVVSSVIYILLSYLFLELIASP